MSSQANFTNDLVKVGDHQRSEIIYNVSEQYVYFGYVWYKDLENCVLTLEHFPDNWNIMRQLVNKTAPYTLKNYNAPGEGEFGKLIGSYKSRIRGSAFNWSLRVKNV